MKAYAAPAVVPTPPPNIHLELTVEEAQTLLAVANWHKFVARLVDDIATLSHPGREVMDTDLLNLFNALRSIKEIPR